MSRDVNVLQRLLGGEHAAVWAYGVVGSRLPAATRPVAAAAEQVHRARRDNLEAVLRAAGTQPVGPAAAYRLPRPVTDPASALAVAVSVEDGTATAYARALAATPTASLRRLAVDALQDAAVRASGWRRLAAPASPSNVAFPGLPGIP